MTWLGCKWVGKWKVLGYIRQRVKSKKLSGEWGDGRSEAILWRKKTIRMSLKYSTCMEIDVPGEQANMGSMGSLKYAKLFAPSSFFMLLLPRASVHLTNIYLFFSRLCLHTFTMKPFLYSPIPSTASPHLFFFVPSPNMNLLPHLPGASQH